MRAAAVVDWAFGHYLRVAPPDFVAARPAATAPRGR